MVEQAETLRFPKKWRLKLVVDSMVAQSSDFQPFSSHGTCKLITKIMQRTQKYIFCRPDKKNRYNFDSFTPDGCCYVDCWSFFFI